MTTSSYEDIIFRIHQLLYAMNDFKSDRVTAIFRQTFRNCELREVSASAVKSIPRLIEHEVLVIDKTGLSIENSISNGIFEIRFDALLQMLADDFLESSSLDLENGQTLIVELDIDGRVSFKIPYETYTDEENWNLQYMQGMEKNSHSEKPKEVEREALDEIRMSSLRMVTAFHGKKRRLEISIGKTLIEKVDLNHVGYIAPLGNYFNKKHNGAVIPTQDGLVLATFDENALTLQTVGDKKPFFTLPYDGIKEKTGLFPFDLQKAYFDLLISDGRYPELARSLEGMDECNGLSEALLKTHPDDAQLKSIIEAAVLSRTLQDRKANEVIDRSSSRIRRTTP